MTTNTVGLSFAAAAEDAELSLSDESGETDISPASEPVVAVVEQPAVETEDETGVLGSLSEQPEQPERESGENARTSRQNAGRRQGCHAS